MRAISLDQRRAESGNETAREAVSRNNGLAAAPGVRSIETSLDKHVDVVPLAHRHLPGMTRRVVDQVGLIVGRTNDPEPTLAQLCRRVPRARKALFYCLPTDFTARQNWF
jgi:hypothetical protein